MTISTTSSPHTYTTEQLCNIITESLSDDKAEEIVSVDLHGKTSIADYMIIASGRSGRHAASLAENLKITLKDYGYNNILLEGIEQGEWVLLDTGDVIVHIFKPEVRDLYKLEKLWSITADEHESEATV